ncbi:MAG TPA: hypothetical protein VGK67_21215 [Myxococcales bacterium]|jgi:hypothetical protein
MAWTRRASKHFDTRGLTDAVITKVGMDGGYAWSLPFGGEGEEAVRKIVVDGANRVVALGSFTGTMNFDLSGGQAERTAPGPTPSAFVLSLEDLGGLEPLEPTYLEPPGPDAGHVCLAKCPAHACGAVSDGCNGKLTCGGCALPEECGGAGQPNVCGIPQAKVLAEGLNHPYTLYVDADAVFVATYGDFHEQGTVPAEGSALLQVPKDGGPAVVLVPKLGMPTGMTSDATHLYFTDPLGTKDATGRALSALRRVPKGGGPVETLVDEAVLSYPIAVDDTDVYWLNGAEAPYTTSHSVMRKPKAGGDPQVLLSNLVGAGSLAIDDTRVYYMASNAPSLGKLASVPKTGGSETLLLENVANGGGLTIEGNAMFWLERRDPATGGTTVLTLSKTPVLGTPATVLSTLGEEAFPVSQSGGIAYAARNGERRAHTDTGAVLSIVPGGTLTVVRGGLDHPKAAVGQGGKVYWVEEGGLSLHGTTGRVVRTP